jgi:hypothetical protein
MRRLLLTLPLLACALHAQDSFFSDWFDRSDQAKADQPHWMTPVVTVTPRLEQEFRTDFLIERMPTGDDLVNLGNSKGLELIPNERVELIFNVPPYLEHNNPKIRDGFGDVSFLGKYRMFAGNEEHGSYILTMFLAATVPTGTASNGAKGGVITPTIAAGKGWGKFDVQSTQDGRKQVFLTLGLILGRFKLNHRLAMAVGAGFQIAATHYHNYDHAAVITVRFPF